jgi:hypothetical protein
MIILITVLSLLLALYCMVSFIDGCVSSQYRHTKGTSVAQQFIYLNPFYHLGYALCVSRNPWDSKYWSDTEYRKREGLPPNNTFYEYDAGAGKKD